MKKAGKASTQRNNVAPQLSTTLLSNFEIPPAVPSHTIISRPPPSLHSTISALYLPCSRQSRPQSVACQHVWAACRICVGPHGTRRIVAANALRFHALVGYHLLRGRAALVEDIIERDANGYRVSHMGHEVRTGYAKRDSGIINVVDEVMDARRGEVHKAVDGGLGGGA